MKARAAHFLRETPVVFIGIVIAIAVVFRVGIGAVKTASAAPEEIPAIHTPVAPAKPRAETSPAKATAVATPAVATPVVADADPTIIVTPDKRGPGAIPKRKPRTHGKR